LEVIGSKLKLLCTRINVSKLPIRCELLWYRLVMHSGSFYWNISAENSSVAVTEWF
jgi:hypothetical protein